MPNDGVKHTDFKRINTIIITPMLLELTSRLSGLSSSRLFSRFCRIGLGAAAADWIAIATRTSSKAKAPAQFVVVAAVRIVIVLD